MFASHVVKHDPVRVPGASLDSTGHSHCWQKTSAWHAGAEEQVVSIHFISVPLCCSSLAFAVINVHSLSPPGLREFEIYLSKDSPRVAFPKIKGLIYRWDAKEVDRWKIRLRADLHLMEGRWELCLQRVWMPMSPASSWCPSPVLAL